MFYVDADMTRLAIAAAETLPVHQLHPIDVAAPAGFCVFAEPTATYLNEGGAYDGLPISIVAVSWGNSPMMGLTRDNGLWMTPWTPTDPDAVVQRVHEQHGTPLTRTRRLAQHAVGPLAWENEVTMTYGPMTELRTLRPTPTRPEAPKPSTPTPAAATSPAAPCTPADCSLSVLDPAASLYPLTRTSNWGTA